MTTERYWLVSAPDGTVADTICRILRGAGSVKTDGVRVVEIAPEHRDSNWMERALVAKYAGEINDH